MDKGHIKKNRSFNFNVYPCMVECLVKRSWLWVNEELHNTSTVLGFTARWI